MAFFRRDIYGSSNVTKFTQELKDFTNLTLKRIALGAHKELIMEALRRIIRRTPVDDGPVKSFATAKNNWRVTLVHAGTAQLNSTSPITDALASIRRLKPFQTAYIVNNVPYINVLEYGSFRPQSPGPASNRWGHKGEIRVSGGFSTQAPNGMVRITYEELRRIPSIKVRNFGFKGIRP